MKSNPLISIIVPIYKVEEYLSECIDSILCQTYTNLEIILVNDGSPDNCGSICDEYALIDNRIIVLHKSNGGLSDARNAGLDMCKGEYISFLDSDDFIHNRFIEILFESIGDNDMAFCDLFYYYDKQPILNNEGSLTTVVYNKDFLLSNISLFKAPLLVVAWNKLYRKKLWDKLRYPKGKIHEDEFVVHHLLNKCETAVFCDIKMYFYRQREGSIMSMVSENRLHNAIEALEDRRVFFLGLNKFEDAKFVYNLKYVLYLQKNFSNRNTFFKNLSYLAILRDPMLKYSTKTRLCCKKFNSRLYYFLNKIL